MQQGNSRYAIEWLLNIIVRRTFWASKSMEAAILDHTNNPFSANFWVFRGVFLCTFAFSGSFKLFSPLLIEKEVYIKHVTKAECSFISTCYICHTIMNLFSGTVSQHAFFAAIFEKWRLLSACVPTSFS